MEGVIMRMDELLTRLVMLGLRDEQQRFFMERKIDMEKLKEAYVVFKFISPYRNLVRDFLKPMYEMVDIGGVWKRAVGIDVDEITKGSTDYDLLRECCLYGDESAVSFHMEDDDTMIEYMKWLSWHFPNNKRVRAIMTYLNVLGRTDDYYKWIVKREGRIRYEMTTGMEKFRDRYKLWIYLNSNVKPIERFLDEVGGKLLVIRNGIVIREKDDGFWRYDKGEWNHYESLTSAIKDMPKIDKMVLKFYDVLR